jgi:hypothetical protein
MCSTKALLAGDAAELSNIFRDRVLRRGKGSEAWGWMTAYGAGDDAGGSGQGGVGPVGQGEKK